MLSLCKDTTFFMRNSSSRYSLLRDYKEIVGLSPAHLYNMTLRFDEIVIHFEYDNGISYQTLEEFKDEEHQINSIIHYEKQLVSIVFAIILNIRL